MLNQIAIMGRLVKDPELRYANETPFCAIRIACDRDYKKENGEKEADFFDVVSWRKLAENVSRYAAKGRMVSVVGRLQTRTWNDRDGNKRYATEIVADHVYFCDSKPKDQNGQGAQNGGAASNAQNGAYGQRGGYGQGSGYGGGYAQPSGYGQPSGYSNADYNAGASGYGSGAMGGYGSGAAGGYNAQNAAASANNGNAAYANGAPGSANANAYAAPPDGFMPNFQDEGVVPNFNEEGTVAEFNEEDGDLPF